MSHAAALWLSLLLLLGNAFFVGAEFAVDGGPPLASSSRWRPPGASAPRSASRRWSRSRRCSRAPSSASPSARCGLGAVAEAALHEMLDPGAARRGSVRGAGATRSPWRWRCSSSPTCTSSSAR